MRDMDVHKDKNEERKYKGLSTINIWRFVSRYLEEKIVRKKIRKFRWDNKKQKNSYCLKEENYSLYI